IVLTGARRDVPRMLAAFDVFAMSSRTEGLPLALPEAMTSELPVVATKVGGIPGVVPENTGVLVPHGDERARRDAIQRLLDGTTLGQKMGAGACAYAKGRFSEERMVAEYVDLYAGGG